MEKEYYRFPTSFELCPPSGSNIQNSRISFKSKKYFDVKEKYHFLSMQHSKRFPCVLLMDELMIHWLYHTPKKLCIVYIVKHTDY